MWEIWSNVERGRMNEEMENEKPPRKYGVEADGGKIRYASR